MGERPQEVVELTELGAMKENGVGFLYSSPFSEYLNRSSVKEQIFSFRPLYYYRFAAQESPAL